MDAEQIRRLRPELARYLRQFDDCFSRRDTQAYLPVYVAGQLSDLPEKSCEPIALVAGVAPRNAGQSPAMAGITLHKNKATSAALRRLVNGWFTFAG